MRAVLTPADLEGGGHRYVPHAGRGGDIAFLQYTGGTTGVAKGAMLTHRNLMESTLHGLAVVCPFAPDDVVLEVKHLRRGNVIKDVSFQLRKGEILGFAGLLGAGRTDVVRAVFGAVSTLRKSAPVAAIMPAIACK